MRLNDDEISKLFDKYGYDYHLLEESNQEYLKEYSTYEDIKEKLEYWVNYNFPILNLEEEGDLFTHIIIRIHSSTLKDMITASMECNINSIQILDILSVLLIDTNTDSILEERIKDYSKNIKYLYDSHYDLNDIYQKNRKVLWINHTLLKKNLSILKDYNIIDNSSSLTIEILKILDIDKLEELIDTFIEISKNTYTYLLQNPSIMKDLQEKPYLLEAIYEEEHKNDLLGAFLEKDNKLILRSNIENKEFIPYHPIYMNQSSFDKVMNNSIERIDEYKYQPIEQFINNIDIDNPLLYNFDGILISRLKVERIYELLVESNLLIKDSILYSVTYKTLMTEETYKELEDLFLQ